MSTGTYQQSTAHLTKNQPKYTRAEALERVRGPATSLVVVASLYIAVIVLGGLIYTGQKTAEMMSAESETSLPLKGETIEERRAREKEEKQRVAEKNFIAFSLASIVGLIGVVCGAVVLAGGLKMKQLKSYKLAYSGAAFATIPVLSPLLVLGIPFGIWAMITIHDKEIKRYFT